MFWIIPVACAVIAASCAAAGAFGVLQARGVVVAHAARLSAATPVDPERLAQVQAKFAAVAAAATAESERAKAALAAIGAALQEMRLREAVLALRVASAAARALVAALGGR